MSITAKEFWDWFINNQHPYLFVNNENMQERDDALNAFGKKLHEFDKGLFFLIGGREDGPQELIITAEGVKTNFPKVEELVNAAPEIKDWKIIAFKPAVDFAFGIKMGEIEYSPENLWFVPLKHPDHPEYLGLHVGVPDYKQEFHNQYEQITFLIIDNMLGERKSAEEIQYVEVAALPPLPSENGFYPLRELDNFIEWKKTNDL